MVAISLSVVCHAPIERVWAALSDISTHDRWMEDAVAIHFVDEQRRGVGTRFECPTKIGPLRTNDKMVVTSWVEGTEIGVEHRGLVGGSGVFRLKADGDKTTVFWTEELQYPIHFGGRAGATVSKPILRWIWRRNLSNLKELVERSPARPL